MPILTPEEIESVRARIEKRLAERNALGVWSTVSNNANTLSRQRVKELRPNAPGPKAPMRAWRAWMTLEFPDFETIKAESDSKEQAERDKIHAEYHLRGLKNLAESGKPFSLNGKVMTVLDFAREVMAQGFAPEKLVRGTMRFRKENTIYGPVRDCRINAAVEYLQTKQENITQS